mmetsp:Transcript_21936/g.52057  ORF Transcript_21936/g.52057 Transcript_21936/m.52057 type:complete len:124 (-) Transcript_21936:52-423(-)|eukprot:334693-Rhodomonas_salina.3
MSSALGSQLGSCEDGPERRASASQEPEPENRVSQEPENRVSQEPVLLTVAPAQVALDVAPSRSLRLALNGCRDGVGTGLASEGLQAEEMQCDSWRSNMDWDQSNEANGSEAGGFAPGEVQFAM